MSFRQTFQGLAALAAVLSAGAAFGVPHYVSLTGTNNSPYLTWADAATNIQSAVDVAAAGETVWVNDGPYVLTNQINIMNGIILRSTNGPAATVINGGYVAGSAVTNNRCIMISNAAAIVSGFTFSNGALIVSSAIDGGAGVAMYGGILSNCTVINNNLFYPSNAPTYKGGAGVFFTAGTVTASRVSCNTLTIYAGASSLIYGGGISAVGTGVPKLISDCVISNNMTVGYYAMRGIGVFLDCGTIRSCTICDNRNSLLAFGGIALAASGAIRMEDCTITRNGVGYGSVYASAGDTAGKAITITNCTISDNKCDQYAGGLYLYGSLASPAYVYNTIITGNTNGTQNGMIVRIDALSSIMKDCTIVSNKINNNAGTCAALHINNASTNNYVLNSTVSYNKGGIGVWALGGVIRNCLIAGNSNAIDHLRGGGLVVDASCSNISVSCCTIVGNTDTNRSAIGAGLRFENTKALSGALSSVSSCIVYSNGVSGTDDVYDACAPLNYNALQYSCVGTNPGFTGAGIIVANPQFKDYAGKNYRLSGISPCINTGSNQDWMTTAVDLDGLTRKRYGTVDMGAYECFYNGSIVKVR